MTVTITEKGLNLTATVDDPTPITCGDATSVVVPVTVTVGGDGATDEDVVVMEVTNYCTKVSTAGTATTWSCDGLPAGETTLRFNVTNGGACVPARAPVLRACAQAPAPLHARPCRHSPTRSEPKLALDGGHALRQLMTPLPVLPPPHPSPRPAASLSPSPASSSPPTLLCPSPASDCTDSTTVTVNIIEEDFTLDADDASGAFCTNSGGSFPLTEVKINVTASGGTLANITDTSGKCEPTNAFTNPGEFTCKGFPDSSEEVNFVAYSANGAPRACLRSAPLTDTCLRWPCACGPLPSRPQHPLCMSTHKTHPRSRAAARACAAGCRATAKSDVTLTQRSISVTATGSAVIPCGANGVADFNITLNVSPTPANSAFTLAANPSSKCKRIEDTNMFNCVGTFTAGEQLQFTAALAADSSACARARQRAAQLHWGGNREADRARKALVRLLAAAALSSLSSRPPSQPRNARADCLATANVTVSDQSPCDSGCITRTIGFWKNKGLQIRNWLVSDPGEAIQLWGRTLTGAPATGFPPTPPAPTAKTCLLPARNAYDFLWMLCEQGQSDCRRARVRARLASGSGGWGTTRSS